MRSMGRIWICMSAIFGLAMLAGCFPPQQHGSVKHNLSALSGSMPTNERVAIIHETRLPGILPTERAVFNPLENLWPLLRDAAN